METLHDSQIWADMMSGYTYDAPNPVLIAELNRVKSVLKHYNDTDPLDAAALDSQIRAILGSCGQNVKILQPFRCDYGSNIHVGENFFANFNFTVLDEAEVRIGRNAFIGPNVSIFTACHSTHPEERADGSEWSLPVTIGDDCWIGGNVVIVPGVTIGNGVTIGAGSVVTRDIPDHQIWAGNPARRIKDAPTRPVAPRRPE